MVLRNHVRGVIAAICAVFELAGCATAIKPDDLKRPVQVTCITIPPGTEAHESRGLQNAAWTTRLSPGPYIAEYGDAEGMFYRAPPGGIYVGRDDMADRPSNLLTHMTYDGGIWVPHDGAVAPHLYIYFSTKSAEMIPLPAEASCSNAVLIRGVDAKGVSVVAFTGAGAIGGTAGGLIGRSINHSSPYGYGQAAGVGLAAGAIGGLIISELIDMDVGKIVHQPVSTDPKFVRAIADAAQNPVSVPRDEGTQGEGTPRSY
jgi:hypothetical protein